VQQVQIYGVSFDMVGKQPIILLKTVEGSRFLPIWIGHPEATAILVHLRGAETPRPMTHDLLTETLKRLGANCIRVSIMELRDNTFHATITVATGDDEEIHIDARPSDAIAVAVRSRAPIFVSDDVLEASGVEFESSSQDEEEVIASFKDFLESVSPEDFASDE